MIKQLVTSLDELLDKFKIIPEDDVDTIRQISNNLISNSYKTPADGVNTIH